MLQEMVLILFNTDKLSSQAYTKYKQMKNIIIILALCFLLISYNSFSQDRDTWQQPEKVMDVIGVKPGMIIGEPGAGKGYFTFKLAKRVGESGRIYANDINEFVLEELNSRAKAENIKNITTITGNVEDPLFPKIKMDMIIMVYVLHDLEKPVAFLKNLKQNLKPDAKLVILEQEPEKTGDYHFLDQKSLLKIVKDAGFKLKKIETFLTKDTLYIFKKN